MNLRDPLTMLVTGLAIGLVGSFTDDLFGGGAAVSVLQVALWIGCAALVIPALLAMRRGAASDRSRRLSSTRAV